MPLVKPYATWRAPPGMWTTLRRDAWFVVQKQTLLPASLAPGAPFRVLIAGSGVCVAEARSEDDVTRDFAEARRLIARAELGLFGLTEAAASAALQRFFEGIAAVDSAAAASKKTKAGSDDDDGGMFAFLGAQPPRDEDLSLVMSPPPPLPPQHPSVWELASSPAAAAGEGAGSGTTLAESSEDVTMEGWMGRLKHAKANAEKPGNWLRRFFVLEHGCLLEFDDEVDARLLLCQNERAPCTTVAVTAAPTVAAAAESDFGDVDVSHRPSTIAPGVVGYVFDLKEPWSGESASYATETIGDLVQWLAFFQSCLGQPHSEVVKLRKCGWLHTSATTSKKWERRWVDVQNGVIESHKRTERGFLPMRGCKLDDHGLGVTLTPATGDPLLLRIDISEWSKWIDALRRCVRLCASEDETVERDILELRKIVADAFALEATSRERSASRHASTPVPSVSTPQQEPPATPSPSPSFKRPFFVLAIDGGGIRGVMSAIILDRITREFPDITDRISLVSGTSIGSILACSVAFGHTPSFCRTLLEGAAKFIFKARPVAIDQPIASATGVLSRAKFTDANLRTALDLMFGKQVLGEARKKVIIPAFLLDNGPASGHDRSCEVRYMHNLTPASQREDTGANTPVVDVVMRSTAAPTYFPSHENFVDGGMFAQDPASLALSLVMSPTRGIAKPPEECVLLSIGTGIVKRYYEDKDGRHHDWGYRQWVPRMLNMFWDAMVLKSAAMCRELLGPRYHRVNPDLETDVPLDDPLQLPTLVACAQDLDLSPTFEWIRIHVYGRVPQQQQQQAQ